jgi:hypothetical protein
LILALVTHALLIGPPELDVPPDEAHAAAGEPVSTEIDMSDEARYQRAIEQLAYGITIGDEQPKQAISILEEALLLLPQFTPQLANDPEALALRAGAHVSLARAYLSVRDETKARDAIDEGIRSAAFGEQLPADAYGPKVEKLWKKRDNAARALARQDVVINCWVACRVYVNERSVDAVEAGAPVPEGEFATRAMFVSSTAGTYRLWVEAADGSSAPLTATFEPGEASEPPLEFIFGTEPVPEAIAPEGPKPAPVVKPAPVKAPRDHAKRLLPRPVEITAMVAGLGLIASGAVLFAINDKCANDATVKGAVPTDGPAACPSLWATDVAGIALMGSGAGLFAAGTILIGIDEVRGAKHEKSARINVGWRFRF